MLTKNKQTSYEVETEVFSGPLHLLLELIEQQELPVTDVALAQVTQQYLAMLEEQEVAPELLADFLVVATRLLYLKSRELLPNLDVEEEGSQKLAGQLRLYQHFVDAAGQIEANYRVSAPVFERAAASLPKPEAPAWPEGLVPESLQVAFDRLLKTIRPFLNLRQTSIERVRSVGERMEELKTMIGTRARLAFRDLTSKASSKMEVVVSFLALLELVKQRTVRTSQGASFGDITIDRV